jgi:hypothetical protein
MTIQKTNNWYPCAQKMLIGCSKSIVFSGSMIPCRFFITRVITIHVRCARCIYPGNKIAVNSGP